MISHEKKFIFVPIRRGAGTSIVRALRKFVGPASDAQKLNRGVLSNGLDEGINYGHWQVPKGYRVVTVCRNPWTKIVSAFRMYRSARLNGRGGGWLSADPTLHEFVDSLPSKEEDTKVWFHTQCSVSELMTDKDEVFQAGTVLRFENLQEDFDNLCQKLALGKIDLPKRSFSGLSDTDHAALHNEYTRSWVSEVHAADIARFGYEFPESPDV